MNTNVDKSLRELETLAALVAKAQSGHDDLRKRADAIYQDRVEAIAKRDGCSMSDAHARARSDDIASRAYSLGIELQERAVATMAAADRLGAHIGR